MEPVAEPRIEKTGRGRTFATAGGFGAILLWSMTIAVARSLSEQLGPVTAAAAVYGVAGMVSLARLACREANRRHIRHLPLNYLIGCGVLFVVYMLFLYLAIGLAANRQQVLEIGLLNYLWPVLMLLLSVALLRKAATLLLFPGTALALLGVFLVLTHGADVSWRTFVVHIGDNPAAYMLGLTAAAAWALYSVLTCKWAGGSAAGGVDLFLPVTAVVLLLICFGVQEPRTWSIRSIAEAICLGMATYAAYGLWDTAMRNGNLVLVAAGSYMTPFFSTVASCLYLTVVPGPGLWIGCGMLIAGTLLSWRSVSDSDGVSIRPVR
ncbi:MAG: aromatic amino acid DMT transporter YddG [Deltaproteobacteria bacterium]|nr:aromatic amino acid DMT transporter YddG [Deltaproteobacteria bacterium]